MIKNGNMKCMYHVFMYYRTNQFEGHFYLNPQLCIKYTVVWTDYRFYSQKLCFFFPEAQTRKSKTDAYMEHLL